MAGSRSGKEDLARLRRVGTTHPHPPVYVFKKQKSFASFLQKRRPFFLQSIVIFMPS